MGGGSGSSSLSFKAPFVTLIVFGFILVMLVGTLQSEGNKTKTTLTTADQSSSSLSTSGKLQQEEQVKVIGRGKSGLVHPQLDLNYMSKRRVPNGPDPIHNRRAGNSGRSPGQS
ncbi:CLAVATA3/ESR (CLE)-related protein 26-like [Durio zibethinus]|uniref:CLAVATA3/ESR (CLE)-related protein 26-like n=1 Tax=Durio zibethinus TaxID=66656 RepID=A0A6P6BET3_DURZI|nr:CLAVATA3/ESR (CLE)-related protein 26-like [Durio zibethinus]